MTRLGPGDSSHKKRVSMGCTNGMVYKKEQLLLPMKSELKGHRMDRRTLLKTVLFGVRRQWLMQIILAFLFRSINTKTIGAIRETHTTQFFSYSNVLLSTCFFQIPAPVKVGKVDRIVLKRHRSKVALSQALHMQKEKHQWTKIQIAQMKSLLQQMRKK